MDRLPEDKKLAPWGEAAGFNAGWDQRGGVKAIYPAIPRRAGRGKTDKVAVSQRLLTHGAAVTDDLAGWPASFVMGGRMSRRPY